MRELVFELRRKLPGPVELVWRIITDWESQGLWMLEASDFVVTTPHRDGAGVEAEATIKIAGVKTRDRIRVDAWVVQRHLGIEHLGWVGGRGDLWLSRAGDETDLHWREALVPPWGPFGAVGLRLFAPMLRRTFERDVEALADLVAGRVEQDQAHG